MIQDAIKRMAILLKPGEITNRTIGVNPRIRYSWLPTITSMSNGERVPVAIRRCNLPMPLRSGGKGDT